MIDVKELRQGNLFHFIDRDNKTITKIVEDIVVGATYSWDYPRNNMIGRHRQIKGFYQSEVMLPIELTTDILLKAGLVNDYSDHFSLQNGNSYEKGTFILSIGKDYCQVSIGTGGENTDHIYLPKSKSLHQLQNLYYSLTGKELEITNL